MVSVKSSFRSAVFDLINPNNFGNNVTMVSFKLKKSFENL